MRRKDLLLVLALLAAGFAASTGVACRERSIEIQRAPERELPPTPPSAPAKAVRATVTSLIGHVGDEVTIAGVIDPTAKPRIPWTVAGKTAHLVAVDLAGGAGGAGVRIVAHLSEPPRCDGPVLITGEVIVARGLIRSGSTEGAYAEPQLDATRWSCR